MSFTSAGSFANPVAKSANSVHVIDNNLSDGYQSGFDLKDLPTNLIPTGPAGSAAFQWGVPSNNSSYPHTSALVFEPLAIDNASAETHFNIANLIYRNGTIVSNTGATHVDLMMRITFSNAMGLDPIDLAFGMDLLNTPNTSDPVDSADIVSLSSPGAPLDFTDAQGNRYSLELTFLVDIDNTDGTLSTPQAFRVFEGEGGLATLRGRFTTSPTFSPIPEPSALMLCAPTLLLLFRRRR